MRIYYRHLTKFLFIILVIIFLYSCENNVNTTIPKADYFPMKAGNYWVFKTYGVNKYYNILPGSESIDSFYTESSYIEQGVEYCTIVKYRNDTLTGEQIKIAQTDNEIKIFQKSDLVGLDQKWYKIADFYNNSWHVFDTIMNNYSIEFNDSTINNSLASYTVNSAFQGYDSINTGGYKFQAQHFYTKWDSKISFDYIFKTSADKFEIQRLNLVYQRYWLVNGIGLVKIQQDPSWIDWHSVPFYDGYKFTSTDLSGKISELLRYHIVD